MPPLSASDSQDRLSGILLRAEEWALHLSELSDMPDIANSGQKCAMELRRLRTRAASTLIRIAVIGGFSSGKSTLVSALPGKLEVSQVTDLDGNPAERVVGILPIAPGPASACPARVVPVSGDAPIDASGRGFLRVRFTDSPDWEDIAANPDPRLVAAYTSDSGDRRMREEEHRTREVAEAEILLSDYKIPAMLYDLPGYGAPGDPYRDSIAGAILDADCFIYVTRANRSLAQDDLDQLNFLYETGWRKRVIWVLTGIDEANQVDQDLIPHWHRIIKQNNDYLADYFGGSGRRSDAAFIGEGFMGVSPIAESRSKGSGGVDMRMEKLRQVIRGMIEAESGRKHVADTAREALGVIRPLASAVLKRWMEEGSERISIGDPAAVLAMKQDSLERVNDALTTASSDLGKILDARVKRASRPFAGLAGHLHGRLDAEIRNADLRDRREENRVVVAATQVLRSWAEAPGGSIELEAQHIEEFQEEIIGWARERIESADVASSPHGSQFDIGLLDFSITVIRTGSRSDIVKQTAAIVGLSTSFTALASYFAGLAGLSAVFPPAAAIAGLAGLMFLGVEIFRRNKDTPTDEMRNEWLSQLDEKAETLQKEFEASLGVRGALMIDGLKKYLEEYKSELQFSIARIKARIDDPGHRRSQDLAEMLEPVKEVGEQLIDELDDLHELCRLGP